MKSKLEIIDYHKFKEILENFVPDNFNAEGCRECNENCNPIVPNDDKDYDLAFKILYNSLIKNQLIKDKKVI